MTWGAPGSLGAAAALGRVQSAAQTSSGAGDTVPLAWMVATLCLSAVLASLVAVLLSQRRRTASLQRNLTSRLRFEKAVSEVSAALGGVPVARMEAIVRTSLEMIRRYLDVDRVSIFELSAEGRVVRTLDNSESQWPMVSDAYAVAQLPSICLPLASLQPFVMERLDDLPAEADRERAAIRAAGVRSLLMVPLEVGGHALGALSCASTLHERNWPAELVQQVGTFAQVLANVLQRRQSDAIVGESDRLRGAVLCSIPAHIAVLDRHGKIIVVNDAWMAYGRANGVQNEASISPGASYLETCASAASNRVPGAADVFEALKAICEGRSDVFDGEYSCDTPHGEQWFAMKAVPLRRPEGGAVVTHRDMTAAKRQETALRESEQRFRLLADALPVGVWIADQGSGCVYFNREWLEFAGRPIEMELGDGWLERVHPDDVQQVVLAYSEAFEARQPFAMEYRLRRHDGLYRWMLDQGTPRFDGDGVFHGFIGGCVDINERIEAEKRQRDLSGRLIGAQEDERRRIARELHDDLQQRLALLAMELDTIALGGADHDVVARARDLWHQTIEISSEVHRLAYRLHPSKLEALGLLATVQGYCRELSQHGLSVVFTHDHVPASIPPHVALCVFRIVQESLQNVLKHSGASGARISMSGAEGALRLVVTDSGRGFDVEAAMNHGGLGLISMRERLHLVGGAMRIRSDPGEGTVIEFDVPLPAETSEAALAATP